MAQHPWGAMLVSRCPRRFQDAQVTGFDRPNHVGTVRRQAPLVAADEIFVRSDNTAASVPVQNAAGRCRGFYFLLDKVIPSPRADQINFTRLTAQRFCHAKPPPTINPARPEARRAPA